MSTKKKPTVFVAMSGGVDSSVAALLLKQQGFEVTGVYMKNWSDPLSAECPWQKDIKDFLNVCRKLGIKQKIETFEEEYRRKVVNYLISGYKKGITPNPDMLCNREIKFKLFLDKARKMGADYIATGHYVIKKSKKDKFQLWQSRDSQKDQSYFLSLLNQNQLKYSLFPVGQYQKSDIRKIAKKAGLTVHNKKDSQGICFIGKVKFRNFLRQFVKPKPGIVKNTEGKIVGKHPGLSFFTIGQRHGLNIGGGRPYFVVKKIKSTNTLVVAENQKDKHLYSRGLKTTSFSWIAGQAPRLPLKCRARIRYRQPLQKCTVKKIKKQLYITFDKPQRAVTPGQFVVLYKGGQMLGGGEISI